MTKYECGMQVLIIEDCRDGSATGQIGTYEGMHLRPDGGWENPRIRLQDGTAIWGCECWWTPVKDAEPLELEREKLYKHKLFLRWLFGLDRSRPRSWAFLERWYIRIRSLIIYPWWKRCDHACGWMWPFGYVPEAGCPVHDPEAQ